MCLYDLEIRQLRMYYLNNMNKIVFLRSKNKEKNPESPNRASDIEDKSLTTENQQHSVGPHTSSNKPPLFQLSIGQKDSKNDILRKL